MRFAIAWASALLALAGCAQPLPPANGPDAGLLAYYPADYAQSRERFWRACKAAKTAPQDECERAVIGQQPEDACAPRVTMTTDDDVGDRLTIDYGFFHARADARTRLLIIQSGIYGSEAASGAAVQALVMERYLAKLRDQGIDVLIVHALDPYGFRTGRRTDQFNVNLNRNLGDRSIYDFVNADYVRFRDLFEPASKVEDDLLDSLAGQLKFLLYVAGTGFDAQPLSKGLDQGQYEYPQGVNYGGRCPAQQKAFIDQVVRPILARDYRQALLLDFHTGLGDAGVLAVIKGKQIDDTSRDPQTRSHLASKLDQLFGKRDAQGIVIRGAESPGFFPTNGDVIDFVPGLARHPEQVLAVTMEYGTMGSDTRSQLRSALRIILETQATFKGCSTEAVCAAVKQDFAALFNPPDETWRLTVLHTADSVFQRLLDPW